MFILLSFGDMINHSNILLLILGLTVLSCSTAGPDKIEFYDSNIPAGSVIAFTGVNLVTMETEEVLYERDIVLKNGKIEQISKHGSQSIPENAVIIDAGGRYLIPGLFDMHVHAHESDLDQYLKYGITTVRNMWGTPDKQVLIEKLEQNKIIGPSIYSASPGIDGNTSWPYTQVLKDPKEAPALVSRLKEEGWYFLKVYNQLTPEVYLSVSESAREQDIRILGHVPVAVHIEDALIQRQYSIEHLTGYDQYLGGTRGFSAWIDINEELIPQISEKTLQAGTWNCPTLVVLDHLSGQMDETMRKQAEENRFKLLNSLHKSDARLLIGSDAGIDLTKPGVSLHDEMEKFVQAGLSPKHVLRIATIEAAEFLGLEDELGSITVGKQANLVLLHENPLEEIRHTLSIEGVVLKGEWIPVSHLE